jgi:pimeloyl-ACP methyl ester carboxylesterase
MSTFVLVHGGFYGGWSWQRVARLLRADGHEVYTPTLTGLGERSHLLSRSITLDTHIQDVVNVLAYEDLRDVILVGHSYGGMVITGAADQMIDRVALLVYMDAHIGANGKSALDVLAGGTGDTLDDMSETQSDDEQWLLPPLPPDATGIVSPADLAFIDAKLSPLPLAALSHKLRLSHDVPHCLPHAYIRCTDRSGMLKYFPSDPLTSFYVQIAAEPGWTIRDLPSGHDPMVTHPREVAAILSELAPDRRLP